METPTVTPAAGAQVSVGAAATPEAMRRTTTAQGLRVPVTLTKGAAEREPGQLAFEKEQMKGEFGAPLRNRAEENNLQILQNFDAAIDATGAEAAFAGPSAARRLGRQRFEQRLPSSQEQNKHCLHQRQKVS
jgi:hypothetical protein